MGQTGKYWAHEHWYLDTPADFITFGGNAQVSGFFTTPEYKPLEMHKLTALGNGDMINLQKLKIINKVIEKKKLLRLVNDTSSFLKIELKRMAGDGISELRGYGTYLAFDVKNEDKTKRAIELLAHSGVLVSQVGPKTIGLRPALTLESKHVAVLRDNIKYVIYSFFGPPPSLRVHLCRLQSELRHRDQRHA